MEHTCGGCYDLSCEACYEARLAWETEREDDPGEYRDCEEWDVEATSQAL